MITTIALGLLAILLVPAFTALRFPNRPAVRHLRHLAALFPEVIADINDATRRLRERQTAWPIEQPGAAEPQPYSLYTEL